MYYFFETFNFVYNLIKDNILGEIYFSHGQMYVSQILKKQKDQLGDLIKNNLVEVY